MELKSDKKFRNWETLMRCVDLISQRNTIYHANHKRHAHKSWCLKVTVMCNIPAMLHKHPAVEICFT